MLVFDINTDLSPELDLDARKIGPWDSSELEVDGELADGESTLDSEPGRHRRKTAHISLTACEFDIDTSLCHEVFLDVPDDESSGDSIWFFDDEGVGLSLRILAAPSDGDYWADELCGSIVDELRSDIGDGAAHTSCARGPYGAEINVWEGRNRAQLVVGARGPAKSGWVVVATMVGPRVTRAHRDLCHHVLGSMVVYRPKNVAMVPGSALELRIKS